MAMVPYTDKNLWRDICVASLIGHCEAIVESGLLGPSSEESLRVLVAETLSAFGMQHHQNQELA